MNIERTGNVWKVSMSTFWFQANYEQMNHLGTYLPFMKRIIELKGAAHD